MKRFLHFIEVIATVVIVIWSIVEFLAIPALFIIIGMLNSFPWQYYAITIGGYMALFVIAEIIAYFIYKALDKKYTPYIERKLNKLFDRFAKIN